MSGNGESITTKRDLSKLFLVLVIFILYTVQLEMSLDLNKVIAQVTNMVASLKAGVLERKAHLKRALETAGDSSIDLEHLKRKIGFSKTTWLVAGLVNNISNHYPPAPLPEDFTVVATDGSNIDVDRHRSTRCYLINIGAAILQYGSAPSAILDSFPRLCSGDEDLVIKPDGGGREQPIEGPLLGIKRGVDECHKLTELVAGLPANIPVLALLDGSLILWGLAGQTYPEFVVNALLNKGFLECMNKMRKLSAGRQLAIASYISFPRSTDVVNVLRLAICPHEPADCDKHCTGKERHCDVVAGVQDRELFSSILEQGERSELFISQSSVVDKHYGEHRVYFFYVKVDDEIARVEVPEWVALDKGRLNLVHSLVLDQCHRGYGYPVALSEAHEQAVVTGSDREEFWQLVEASLVGEKMSTSGSAKNTSKRTRWI